MMGIFSKCEVKEEDASFSKSFKLIEVLKDRLSKLKNSCCIWNVFWSCKG